MPHSGKTKKGMSYPSKPGHMKPPKKPVKKGKR